MARCNLCLERWNTVLTRNQPAGFQHAGVPNINAELLGALAPDMPATIIVLIIEHIAISKSFGRINNYIRQLLFYYAQGGLLGQAVLHSTDTLHPSHPQPFSM